jgi:hypothetical protein
VSLEAVPPSALHVRAQTFLRASLRGPAPSARAFDAPALDLARFQAERIPALARLARARGVDLGAARTAAEIPAVPCDLFRLARVAAHPAERDAIVFRTSGTSQGARGEHPFQSTETYELAALSWGERMLWPDRAALRVLLLAPSLAEVPDSSLGFMLDRFAARLGGPASVHVRAGALDVEGLARAAAGARAAEEPAIVLGTSFAFVHLLDAIEGTGGAAELRLPPGSRAMQTGGFKGRSRDVPAEELRRRIAGLFGLPGTHVAGEYGMTELSSQLYEGALAAALGFPAGASGEGPGVYLAPPWVRVTAADPASLLSLPAGEVGVARIVDLANVDSAVAIQTADLVRVDAEGRAVELLGRAPEATPRGCSLAIDAMLGGA